MATTIKRRWHGAAPAQRARWAAAIERWSRDDDDGRVAAALRDVDPADGPALYAAAWLASRDTCARTDHEAVVVTYGLYGIEYGELAGPTSEQPGLLEDHDGGYDHDTVVCCPVDHRRSQILRRAWARLAEAERWPLLLSDVSAAVAEEARRAGVTRMREVDQGVVEGKRVYLLEWTNGVQVLDGGDGDPVWQCDCSPEEWQAACEGCGIFGRCGEDCA
jgi:hypothetical protein